MCHTSGGDWNPGCGIDPRYPTRWGSPAGAMTPITRVKYPQEYPCIFGHSYGPHNNAIISTRVSMEVIETS